ncbi:uncharacterized protein TNCV_1014481 [Trichonephila clavipes]|uniref:Uncharacterized protein n=1 Tax=Trichonephila clavipes TaxID=2585209 RepID=A0A8X6VXU2_TRICX|nr:uncharacterized protein TNCV_1014481 [Trichonephila clavipes]
MSPRSPFFNQTMLSLTQQGCHKTVYVLLLPFLGLPDPQICLQSSVSGIIWDGELGILKFERTRGKVTANMERNVSIHHTELVYLNVRSYRIVHSRWRRFNRVLNPPFFCHCYLYGTEGARDENYD